nr:hypothetical protein [Acidobacteriota bacterium]
MRDFPRLKFLLSLLAAAVLLFNAEALAQKRGALKLPAKNAPASSPKISFAPPRLVVQYGHERPIEAAAFSRDGRYAVTGSWDEGVAVLWDLEAGTEIRRFPDSERGGAQDGYMAVAVSPDNRLVAASSETGVRVFDVATGRVVKHLKDAKMGGGIILINLDFSDDGARLTAGGEVYEWATGRVVGRVRPRTEHERGEAATPDGRLVVEK